MLTIADTLKHYKRKDIQEAMIVAAQDKEIAIKYGEKGFGKRPDVLLHENDILEFAKKGATSFHMSEEHWHEPLQLSTNLKKIELDTLRKAWDLILDIDCKELEYSKIAAQLIIKALQKHEIECTAKFSGNHGFHIAVPHTQFPQAVRGIPTSTLFPDGPRKIANYLSHILKKQLSDELLKYYPIEKILSDTDTKYEEAVINGVLNPYKIIGIDTVLIASRHLYRMPYSFNEKSGLLSIPVNPNKILEFDKETAKPEKVIPEKTFLQSKGNATNLLINALDFTTETKTEIKEQKVWENVEKVPEQFFPPCIQLISQGLKDGKKRATFILINFLKSCGWEKDEIQHYLEEWNKKNPEPLKNQILVGQIRYHTTQATKLPPNCDNQAYMKGIGVCQPDNFCKKIRNPANYAILKRKFAESNIKQNKRTKKNERDNIRADKSQENPERKTP
ncbi:hypothetical protein HY486_03410 [Candidatus Woesearchaeota archaeon]|nr:hypothetical protein [Candidatus Woesearchaeota archaeon]